MWSIKLFYVIILPLSQTWSSLTTYQVMSDPVASIFSKPGPNGNNIAPKAHLLDAVWIDVSNRNNGVNTIFLEDSHVQTKPSVIYYGGSSFNGNTDFYNTTPIIFLSSNPIGDSIKLANMRHKDP